MDWSGVAWEIVSGGAKTALLITGILVVLMVGLELIRDAHLLEKAAGAAGPVMKWFRLPEQAAYPLLAGGLLGISYGSGLILAFTQDGNLSRRDLTLIGMFLSIAHGMIEDPLLFVALGADWWIVFLTRTALGVLVAVILSRALRPDRAAG